MRLPLPVEGATGGSDGVLCCLATDFTALAVERSPADACVEVVNADMREGFEEVSDEATRLS